MAEQELFGEEPEVFTTEELFSDPQFPQTPRQSEAQVTTTAKLAAIEAPDEGVAFDEAVRQNEELIRLGEERVLRAEAALRARNQRQNAVDTVSFDALYGGDQPTAAAVVSVSPELEELNEAFDSSLEQRAVEAMQNEEMVNNPDYGARVQELFADNTGSTIDIARDEVAKTLIYQKHLDEYREKIKRKGWDKLIKRTQEVGALLLPLYDTQSKLILPETGRDVEGLDRVSAGKTVQRRIQNLWSLPVGEFETQVAELFSNADRSGIFGENELAALAVFEQGAKGTHGRPGVIFDDTIGFIDSIPFAAAAARFTTRGVLTAAGAAKVAGARSTATTLHADALAAVRKTAESTGDISEDAVDAVTDLIPAALRPDKGIDEAGVGVSGELARKLEEIEAVGKAVDSITTQGRLSDGQMQELFARTEKHINDTTTHNIADLKRRVDPLTKLGFVDTYIGKKAGGGYATEAAAKGAATRMGFSEDAFDIAEDQGHFFVRQSYVVEELAANGMPLVSRPDNSVEVIPDTGPFRAGVQNPDRSLPEDLVVRRHEAEMAGIRFREKVVKPLEKMLIPFNKKDMRALNAVMTKGRNERRWFTVDEFAGEWKQATGEDPKDFHFSGYAAAVKANNIDHQVRNVHLYTERARRGLKTVTINSRNLTLDKVNAKEIGITNIDELLSTRMYDAEDGLFRTGKDVSPEELADLRTRLESGNVKVIRLEEAVRVEGDPIDTILVGNRQVDIAPLSRQQLSYVPGGHLLRRTPWFGKQARSGVYKDGTEYVDGPSTLFAYRTEMSGTKHLEEVNNALRTYREYKAGLTPQGSVANARSLVAVRRAMAESPFRSLDEFEELVNSGRLDPNTDIELVFDRGLPSAYTKNDGLLSNPNIHKLFDDSQLEDGIVQWTRTTGRDYYGKRSEGLLSPHEEADVVIDPLASISRGLENAAKTHAWDHYITRSMEEWTRAAAAYVDPKSLQGKNDYRALFYNARFLEQGSSRGKQIVQNLEENRVLIKRTLGIPTPSQKQFEATKRNLARFVEAKGGDLGTKAVMKIDDISSNNPINALNAMVFDAWLGLGDVSQLWVQTQTLLTATAASPKYGAQALGMLFPMRLAVINQSDNVLDYIAKTGKAIHNQTPDDFKAMVREFRDSGWNAPGGELSYLANHSNSIASAGLGAYVNRRRQNLRFVFNEAERLNRIGAWQIAWKETKELNPNMATDSEEFLAIVSKRTSDYSLNMTAASNAKIQQGIFSPMTRFMGYQMRMLEALLPQPFGGSQFGAAAKARILASQVILYGSKGLPFGHKISDMAGNMYEQATGQELTEEQTKWLESGAIDALLYSLSGGQLNTDAAERAGFGRGLDYTFERMSDGSMSSALAAYGGPAYSFSSRYAESVKRVMTYFKGTRGPLELDPQDAQFVLNELLVKHVNVAKRADKARMIWKLGMVVDPRSGRPLFEASKLEGFAALLGVPLYEETRSYSLYDEVEDFDAEVKFNGQLLAKLDRLAFQAMADGDNKALNNHMNQGAIILAQYQDDPLKQQAIAKYATNELGYTGTQWDNLLQRIQSRMGPDALPPEGLRYEDDGE